MYDVYKEVDEVKELPYGSDVCIALVLNLIQ